MLRVAVSIFVTFICVADGHVSYADSAPRTRKMNHVTVKTSAVPYAATIFDGREFVCTGSLINNQLVVTAASPFFTRQGNVGTLTVRLGSKRKTSGGTILSIEQLHIHPSYTPGLPEYDVALLGLKQNVIATPLHSAITTGAKKCSPKQFYSPVWYKEGEVNGDTDALRVLWYGVASRQWCRQLLSQHNITLTNNIACLLPNRSHICLQAGGSGLVDAAPRPTQLWGVISSWKSPYCGTFLAPVLATRLTARRIRDWLHQYLPAPGKTADARPVNNRLLGHNILG